MVMGLNIKHLSGDYFKDTNIKVDTERSNTIEIK